MITEDIKQQLVSNAVKAILNSNGTLLYSDKKFCNTFAGICSRKGKFKPLKSNHKLRL